MIVSGGENVFPAEVEELLGSHESIQEAAAIGVDDEKFGQRLKAFVVLRKGAKLSEDEIKGYVKDNLANYKVPREVVFLDELPRNPTGKVLKRELAEPRAARRREGRRREKEKRRASRPAQAVWRPRKPSIRRQASSHASAYSSKRRSKNECGAPGYTWISWSRPASVRRASNCSTSLHRNRLVRPAEQAEQRRADVSGSLERPVDAEPRPGEHAVEADHGSEVGQVGAGEERLEPAEAEPDRGDGPRARPLAQRGDRGGGVLLDSGDRQLLNVGHVLELLVARAEAGRPAEVVHDDRVVAGLREPLGQLRVERIQPPDVREDHDPALAV